MGCSTSKKETVTTGQQGHADYGGDYPFVDKMYSSSVKVKDLLSWTEQRVLEVLDWTEFSLRPDGNFRRDGESTDVFPIAGISIKWRYDPTERVMTFDFWSGGEKWAWRYDKLRPNDDFSHWDAVGHANSDTFEFTMDLQNP